jgi:hypothetical protein
MATVALDRRGAELARAFVTADQADYSPFYFVSGRRFSHPGWPAGVQPPTREELRRLVHHGWLEVDRTVGPGWQVFPSGVARVEFGSEVEHDLVVALNDPDQRLGVILEGTVKAFEGDPSEPLQLLPMSDRSVVHHPHWPLPPDVARLHDVRQLEDLGLVKVVAQKRGLAFWPSTDGRMAVYNAPELLEHRGQNAASEHEAGRLRRLAERLRAGDLAVGVLAGTATAVIRGLIGL